MIFLSSFVKNCLIENLSVILRNVIIRIFCNNKTKSLIMYSIKRLLCTVIATMTLASVAAQNKYDLNEDGAVNGADVVELYNYILNGSSDDGKAQSVTVKNLGSSVTFKMIPVVGGTFFMGATAEQINPNKDETPAHEVTVSDFLIGETEVTQELWQTVTGSRPVADSYQWSEDRGVGKNYPAYYISYADCVTFIEKLNTLTGLSFRMPTEAEWEYAARGGSKSQRYQYSGSDNLDDVAWSNCSRIKKLQPVGSKNPNELGIYDMSGNVGEWCSDWYGQYSADTQTNPVGPSSGTERVNRGGRWYYVVNGARNSFRGRYAPSARYSNLGLRLVLEK